MQWLSRLLPDRRGEALGIGNADPQHGVILEPDNPGNLVDERDRQPGEVVRAKRESVVDEAEPQSNRGVPAVRASDEGVVDVVERRLYLDSPVGRDEVSIVENIDAVIVVHAQREEQCRPSLVESVRKVLRCHDLQVARGVAAKLISILRIRRSDKLFTMLLRW